MKHGRAAMAAHVRLADHLPLSPVLAFTITPLASRSEFEFRVRAHNEMGWGPFSLPSPLFRTGRKL